jgi:hypothetical protein
MGPENQEDITHMTDTAMLPDDEQAKKFKELANKRVNDICKRLRNLGNLANPRIYHYTPEQIDAIFSAIEKQGSLAKTKFTESANNDEFIHL